jgi:hypothetical protein
LQKQFRGAETFASDCRHRMNGPSPFEPRVVVALVAALVALLATSLLLTGAVRERANGNLVGANTYSRSSIGHLGLFDALQKLDYRVARGQHDVLAQLGANSILILAEPTSALSGSSGDSDLLKAETILVVLPKWDVRRSPERNDWISDAQLSHPYAAQAILRAVAGSGEVVRVSSPSRFRNSLAIPDPTVSRPLQLIKNSKLRPIVATAEGILLGEFREGRRRIWVLADPDPIENHGIGKGDNLAFATAVIYAMLAGKPGTLVFDETLHGFEHSPPSARNFLLEFPFNLIALQIVAAVALLLMASVGRFGTPEIPDRVLRAGKQNLISNTASLIDHAGHHAAIQRRYIGMVLQDTGRLLRAPRQLNDYELAAWLDRAGEASGLRSDCVALLGRIAAKSQDLASLFTEARTIHAWRKDLLNGISGRLGDY